LRDYSPKVDAAGTQIFLDSTSWPTRLAQCKQARLPPFTLPDP